VKVPYVRHLTLVIVVGQAVCLLATLGSPELLFRILFIPELAMNGEWWRFFTFIFLPMSTHPFWAAFALYFFYLMGTALEAEWGEPKYNAYLALGCVLTIGFALLNPGFAIGNAHILGSVFLAFAWLFPEFEILLFFVLPVRVKYVAMFMWGIYAWSFFTGGVGEKLSVAASTVTFFVFFAREIVGAFLGAGRGAQAKVASAGFAKEAFHRCVECDITELKDPNMHFRVCIHCTGGAEFCREHLGSHDHRKTDTVI